MTRQAICVGGPPALHEALTTAFTAADVKLRVIPAALTGQALEDFRGEEHETDIFVWAVAEPSAARFETVTVDEFRSYLDRTIYSAFQMMQPCLVTMERRRFGRLLVLTNMNGHLGDEDILASAVSGALEGFIRSVAREGARKGVTANALVLGRVDGWSEVNSKISEPFYELYFPYRDAFEVADVARAVAELTTGASKLNGQVIGYDGGTML